MTAYTLVHETFDLNGFNKFKLIELNIYYAIVH